MVFGTPAALWLSGEALALLALRLDDSSFYGQ